MQPNDPAANTNQRIPNLTLPGTYPYVRGYQFRDGSWWRQDETPGFEGYARGHISGTFREMTPLAGTKELVVNTHHHYVGAGATYTVQYNHDEKIAGSEVGRISNDHFSEFGNDHMAAIGGDVIRAAAGITFLHSTHGTQVTSTGDHVTDHNDGNHHINIAGDHVQYTQGVKYDYVGQDHGIYVPNGNMDTNVGLDVNIQSAQQITIKVNGSVITVNGQNIIIHDNNNNEIGMVSSKLYVKPVNDSTNVYLGGNGQNDSLYDLIKTASGAVSINTKVKITQGNG